MYICITFQIKKSHVVTSHVCYFNIYIKKKKTWLNVTRTVSTHSLIIMCILSQTRSIIFFFYYYHYRRYLYVMSTTSSYTRKKKYILKWKQKCFIEKYCLWTFISFCKKKIFLLEKSHSTAKKKNDTCSHTLSHNLIRIFAWKS